MKLIKKLLVILLVVFSSCNSQTKADAVKLNKREIQKEDDLKKNIYEEAPIDFLNNKYKTDFYLPDESPSYPTFSFFDKKVGGFSLSYIGKTSLIQEDWNVQNSTGFFSQFKNIDQAIDDSVLMSKEIDKFLKSKLDEYYIICNFLPEESISKYYDDSGDFDLKEDAYRYFYLWDNNNWVYLKKERDKDVLIEGISYYNSLIRSYKLKNKSKIDKKYYGNFSVYVETEATMNGMASITYNFSVSEEKLFLEMITYHQSAICDGKYKAIMNDHTAELYYDGPDENCLSIEPNFRIKFDNNKFYIKGVGGEGTINEWIRLNKK